MSETTTIEKTDSMKTLQSFETNSMASGSANHKGITSKYDGQITPPNGTAHMAQAGPTQPMAQTRPAQPMAQTGATRPMTQNQPMGQTPNPKVICTVRPMDAVSLKSDKRSIAMSPESISGMSSQTGGQITPPNGTQTQPAKTQAIVNTQPMAQTGPTQPMAQNQPMGQTGQTPSSTVTSHTMRPMEAIFGPHPVLVQCPHCNCECLTDTRFKAGNTLRSSICCLCIALTFCCTCCLAFIPALFDDFYDVHHYCRKCGHLIGIYRRPCSFK